MPQPHLRQQPGFNDMSLLPQHSMSKQLQELQRQQQLQQFGDARQHNSVNQLPMIMKQATGCQFAPMINGAPINDAPQIFMNLMPHVAPPSAQGVPNGLMYPHEQGQAQHSLCLSPQQLDASLYGTPIGRGGHFSQSSYLQGVPGDSANSLTKASLNQALKPIMQLPAFNNSFLGGQRMMSQEQVCMPGEAFSSKHGFQKRNPFEQNPSQGLYNGVLPENFEQGNVRQRNVSVQELNVMQGRGGLPPGLLLEKTAQIGSSEGHVTLDPMEQKILFSTDEDIWDATFVRQSDIGSGSFGNSSGRYSALLQSAVAEASSNDTDLQVWSGLMFQNTELSTENQPSSFVDSGKQPLQSASFCSKPSPVYIDSNMTSRLTDIKKSGSPFLLEQSEGLHRDSSHESLQQSPENNGKWFNSNQQKRSPVEENQHFQPLEQLENAWGGQVYQRSKSDAHQKSIYVHNNSSIPCSKPKGRTFLPSPKGENSALDTGANEKTFENRWTGDISEAGYKGRDLDGHLWKTDGNCAARSLSSSIRGLEFKQSGTDNTLVNREGSQVNSVAALPNLNTTKSIQETTEQIPDSHRLDYMEIVNIYARHKENESMGMDQHQLDNGPQSLNHSDKGAADIFENRQKSYQKENSSSDSYNSSSSQRSTAGRKVRENVWLNASDYQSVSGGSQKSPSQVMCSPGLRSSKQEYFGQLKSTGKFSTSVMGLEKGHLPDIQSNLKSPVEVASRGNDGSNVSAAGFYDSGVTAQTSDRQELLPTKSREASSVPHFLSQVPKKQYPDTSSDQPYSQSYASQQSGLRLGPQLQQLPNSDHLYSSQGPPQTENSLTADTSSTSHLRNQLHGQFISNAAVAHQFSHSQLGTVSRLPPFNLAHSQDASQLIFAHRSGQSFPALEAVHASQPSDMLAMPQQSGFLNKPSNVWTKIPTQQHLSADELHNVPFTDLSSNRSLETPSLVLRELNDQNLPKDADSMNSRGYDHEEKLEKERSHNLAPSETLNPAAQTGNSIQGKESVATTLETHFLQPNFEKLQYDSNQNPSLSRRDFDAFGWSLKPSFDVHQSFTSLHQVQAMNNLDPEVSKAFKSQNTLQAALLKGEESFYQHTTRVEDPTDSKMHAEPRVDPHPSRDIRTESFTQEVRADQTLQASSGPILQSLPSLEMAQYGWNSSWNHSSSTQMESNQVENSQNSEQIMVPHWFKQYGNIRNGQTLPMYNAKMVRLSMEQISLGKPSENLHAHSSVEQMNASISRVDNTSTAIAADLVGSEHLQTLYTSTSGVADQTFSVLRPKKRKTATPVLLPWHKEVTDGSQTFQIISIAKHDWTQATNCLVEKKEYGSYVTEGNFPMVRPKRRLTVTTHLMQQLLPPAPPAILQADAMSKYDCVLYSVAKLVLGDACSLTSCVRNDSDNTMTSEKLMRVGNHNFSKAFEDFTIRAKKLENDLLRLDKTISILDIRLECQELEKYSLMNRFAKFHGRLQVDATESTSSGAPRPFFQRYVTALPLPRILPEQMQCLSL